MCGLCYYHNKEAKDVSKSVYRRYEDQKSRGTQGFGLVGMDMSTLKIVGYSRVENEKEIRDVMNKMPMANSILFHHRNPTSTPNIAECAHPILVDNQELDNAYFVIHNGVISNPSQMKLEHEKIGYKYTTEMRVEEKYVTAEKEYLFEPEIKFNDSEALAIELARVIEGKKDKIEARGSMACIVLCCTKEGTAKSLYYGRNYLNPLYIEESKTTLCLRSGDSKQSETVKADTLYCYDFITGETTSRELDFPNSYEYKERNWNRNNWHGQDHTSKLPAIMQDDKDREAYEDYNYEEFRGRPLETPEEYLEDFSQIDYTIEDLLGEGTSLDEMENDLLEEIYLVESLIKWEKNINQTEHLPKLLERQKLLEARANLVSAIITAEPEQDTETGEWPDNIPRIGFETNK